jgi:hypothetical protein
MIWWTRSRNCGTRSGSLGRCRFASTSLSPRLSDSPRILKSICDRNGLSRSTSLASLPRNFWSTSDDAICAVALLVRAALSVHSGVNVGVACVPVAAGLICVAVLWLWLGEEEEKNALMPRRGAVYDGIMYNDVSMYVDIKKLYACRKAAELEQRQQRPGSNLVFKSSVAPGGWWGARELHPELARWLSRR